MNCALQPFPFVVIVATRQFFFWFKPLPSSSYVHSSHNKKKKKKEKKGKDISSICVSHVAPSYNLAPFHLQFRSS
jgi:hypothetical protein